MQANIDKNRIHFKDVYGLQDFFSNDTKKIFRVETISPNLEMARIRDVLIRLEVNKYFDYINTLEEVNCTRSSGIVTVDYGSSDKVALKNSCRMISEAVGRKLILIYALGGVSEQFWGDLNPDCLAEYVVTEIYFQHLTDDSQIYIFNCPCIFYQQKITALKEFLFIDNISDPRLNSLINVSVLEDILFRQEDYGILFTDRAFVEDIYLPRKFTAKIFITHQIVNLLASPLTIPDCFIFAGVKNKAHLTEILKASKKFSRRIWSNDNILTFENHQNAHDFFEKRLGDGPIHLISIDNANNLTWVNSKGSLANIRNTALTKPDEFIDEDALFEKRIFIITGPPGSGKSTTLRKTYARHPSAWTIIMDSFSKLPESMSKTEAINFLSNFIDNENHALTKAILEDALFSFKSKPLYLIFDETHEEINNLNSFTKLLQFLRRDTKAYIWIAARKSNNIIFEDALSVFSSHLKEINSDEQKSYFFTAWDTPQFFPIISKTDFLGIPILLKILAQIGQCSSIDLDNVSDIFRMFLKQQYTLHSKSNSLPETLMDFVSRHRNLALQYSKSTETSLHATYDSLTFTHPILTDYFLADWANTCLQNSTSSMEEKRMVSRIFVEKRFSTTRLFLSRIVNTDINSYQEPEIFFNENKEWAMHVLIRENHLSLASLFLGRKFLEVNLNLFTSKNSAGKSILQLADELHKEEFIDKILDSFHGFSDEKLMSSLLIGARFSDEKLLLRIPQLDDKLTFYKKLVEKCFDFIKQNKLKELRDCVNTIEDSIIRPYLFTTFLDGGTMLHLAASLGLKDIVIYLVELADVPVNILNAIRATPVHCAALTGKLDIIEYLTSKGANLNIKDSNSKTALMNSSNKGQIDVVKWLLEQHLIDKKCCDRNGISCLSHAAKSGHTNIVELLLNNGFDVDDVNLQDNLGMNALAWAVKAGHKDLTMFLLNYGADRNIKDINGRNLLQLAVKAKQWDMVKCLTFRLVDINITNFNGTTCLEHMIYDNKWDFVEYLIREGASIKFDTFKPIQHVVKSNKWKIILLMAEHGADIISTLTIEEKGYLLNLLQGNNFDTSLFNTIRLGNPDLLEMLIRQHNSNNVEDILAKCYEQMIFKNISLKNEIKWYIESKLVQIRSARERELKLSEEAAKERLNFICHQIRILENNHSGKHGKIIDQDFIIRATFICQYIEMIKMTKSFKNAGPILEQTEFCLLIFLGFFVQPRNDDFCYRLLLDQDRIMRYLSNFSDNFQQKPTNENYLQMLESDYKIIKDIYCLNKISSCIKLAISIKNVEDQINSFALIRYLQVIGERLKELSNSIADYLLYSAPTDVKVILTSLRNALSHSHTFKSKAELESLLKRDKTHFLQIQNDLKKVKTEIDFLLYTKKIQCLENYSLKRSENCNNTRRINQYIDWSSHENLNSENYEFDELKTIKSLVSQLSSITSNRSQEERTFVEQLQREIAKIEGHLFGRIDDSKKTFVGIRSKVRSSQPIIPITSASNLSEVRYFSKYRNFIYQPVLKNLGHISALYYTKLDSEEVFKIFEILFKIYYIINFEANKIETIKVSQKSLSLLSKQENMISFDAFNKIKEQLEGETEKNDFEKHVSEHLELYRFSCQKPPNNKAEDDLKLLAIMPDIKKKLIKHLKKKELQKYYKQMSDINLIEQFLNIFTDPKGLGSNSVKFYETLRKFCSTCSNPDVIQAADKFIEQDKKQIQTMVIEKISILQSIMSANNEKLQDHFVQSAIEMLSLDVLEVLIKVGILPSYTQSFDEFAPILVNTALRNYLAHGNLLIDILPYDPITAIVSIVKRLDTTNLNLFSGDTVQLPIRKSKPQKNPSIEIFKSKLDQLWDLGDLYSDKESKLNNAIEKDDIAIFSLTIVNRQHNLNTYFLKAVKAGALNIAHYIVNNMLKINRIDTAVFLCEAANHGHQELVRFLIKLGSHLSLSEVLFKAAYNGHESVVDLLLQYDPKLIQNASLSLAAAAQNGHELVVTQLLKWGANVNAYNKHHAPALVLAAAQGHDCIVKRLLEQGALIDEFDENNKPALYIACFHGHESVVEQLLKCKPNINLPNEFTPLHAAAYGGYETIVWKLLQHGANVNAIGVNQCTPLQMAAQNNHVQVVKLLIERGAKIDTPDIYGRTALLIAAEIGHYFVIAELLKHNASMNLHDNNKSTPLYAAAAYGHGSVVEQLLNHHANSNESVANRVSPLYIAAQNGHESVVLHLLKHGANTKLKPNPLYIAAHNGYGAIVKHLLEYGANPNEVDRDKTSPLHIAAHNGHELVVKELLVKDGVHIEAIDKNGRTPLQLAVSNGHESVVKQLLEKGANVNASDNVQIVPLYEAAQNGDESIVSLLVKYKANINVSCSAKNTPLIGAATMGHEKVVKRLLELGANPNMSDKDEMTALHVAVQQGHYLVVKYLLKYDANVNILNIDQVSPLSLAANRGYKSIVKLLLEQGANINTPKNDGATPLLLAAFNGHEPVVKWLLEKGAKVDVPRNDQATPLFVASFNGHKSIVQMLLHHGAKIDKYTCDQVTPLCAAASNGHDSIVKDLLESHANVNIPNKSGATPLFFAAQNGHESIVRHLLEYEAIIDAPNKDLSTPLSRSVRNGHKKIAELLLKKGTNVNSCDDSDATPLLYAADKGDKVMTELLLKHGAHINACQKDYTTPLYVAASNGHEEVVELLLEKGANTNVSRTDQSTALYAAASNGHEVVVNLLLKYEANINGRKGDGATALYVAAQNGHELVVKELLNRGADMNIPNQYKASPLFIAAQNNHHLVVELLLGHKADINAPDQDKCTPLLVAARFGNKSVVEQLIQYGANINAPDKDSTTPLLAAAFAGHDSVVECLLQHNADINACDKNQASPLFAAASCNHHYIAELLLKHKANLEILYKGEYTPLHMAAQKGYGSMVKLLLEHRADINGAYTKQVQKCTPLFTAAFLGHENVVNQLLEEGANVKLADKEQVDPLYVACQNGHTAIVENLLLHGADINSEDLNGVTPLYIAAQKGQQVVVEKLLKHGAKVNKSNKYKVTPLHIAAARGHCGIVKLLLDHHADFYVIDTEGNNVLYTAAYLGNVGVVKELLEGGANPNFSSKDQITPLYASAQNGCEAVVELLLDYRADVNASRTNGMTPLFIAAVTGCTTTVEVLLKHGANVNLHSINHASPLLMACHKGHQAIVELLLRYNADVNKADKSQATPLIVSCFLGYCSIVQLLLEYGADVNICYTKQCTPLYVAAEKGHKAAIQHLLEYGADINAANENQVTPLHVAAQNHQQEVVEYLIENGADIDRTLRIAIEQGDEYVVELLSKYRQLMNQ